MKKSIIQFLISRAGGMFTPIIAGAVAWGVTQLGQWNAPLASTVDEAAVTAFLWGAILALINAWTNKVQVEGVKQIQNFLEVKPDGWAGPKTYVEVRKAAAANQ
jgi:hypothetical protein